MCGGIAFGEFQDAFNSNKGSGKDVGTARGQVGDGESFVQGKCCELSA
jgi:hypothetical protein